MKLPKFSLRYLFLIFVFISVIFSSCSTPTAQIVEVTRVSQQTIIVPQTVVVTQIIEIIITATPIPVTSTPLATNTPLPSPTPEFAKWNSTQVIEAFMLAGLEAESTYTMTKDDYGLAPMVAKEGTRFMIPSLCAGCGGRVMSFANAADLELTKAYYDELGRSSAVFFSWTFVRDNILVQINGALPEEKANAYQAALDTLGS